VIVVDDASTDETAEVAERHGARVIQAKSNLGPGGARNLGVRHAQGEYLAFTDADCRVPTDWLGNLQNAYASGEYCGVSGPYNDAADDTTLLHLIHHALAHSQRNMPDEIESTISSNLFVARLDFDSVGGFPDYALPWGSMPFFGNEDEDFGFLLVRKTGKKVKWLKHNGIFHAYRTSWQGYFRQQWRYAQAILISYARFPAMMTTTSNYSRGDGASSVLTALLALVALLASVMLFEPMVLLGTLPFFIRNWAGYRALMQSAENDDERWRIALLAFPIYAFTALAWTKGLILGAIKGAACFVFWQIGNREEHSEAEDEC
jgi:glycosyltransferase involved in cell wall biosynthesis